MKSSMQTRLIMISSGMLVLAIACICFANIFWLPYYYQSEKVSNMKNAYNNVVKQVSGVEWGSISEDELDNTYDALDRLSSDNNVSIYIMQIKAYAGSGDIATINYVYPSSSERLQEVSREQLGKYVKNKYFGTSLGSNCTLLGRSSSYEVYKVYDNRLQSNFLELTGQLPDNYWVYLRTNYQGMKESVGVSNRFMVQVGGIILLLGILCMFFVSKKYTKPILKLAQHAKEMEKLNFSSRYTEERQDEIGVLGNSMNSLADKLEETISELKTANNELQLDLERRTEQEEMRREFLANVSHELKTPIALIQGYAEGLQDNINEDAEGREFYCEVIVDEANKMNKMVKRLLSLNQLEFGNDQVHLEHFDLRGVVDSVLHSTDILFKQKNVELSYQPSDEPVMVWADEYMIEEVVTNYISNALNHVEFDNKIEIKMSWEEGKVRTSVFNTGKPIPESDIDKIWTKFYKVDKARTREYGGNGIGLSIVKAIMDAHNQDYGVVNYDNGVEFWFELDIQ